MYRKLLLIFIIFLFCKNVSAQYDAECFVSTKELINKEIANIPPETVHVKDTIIEPGNVKHYIDTVVRIVNMDKISHVNKIVGCRLPDFNFFNLAGEEFSINNIKTNFTIVSFSFIDCGDVCNAGIHSFSKLKTTLKDSITIINIYKESTPRVVDFAKDFESNIEFVGNADILAYNYSIEYGSAIFYLLDKYKNIIYVKAGFHYTYSPNEIYTQLLEKIRATSCPD